MLDRKNLNWCTPFFAVSQWPWYESISSHDVVFSGDLTHSEENPFLLEEGTDILECVCKNPAPSSPLTDWQQYYQYVFKYLLLGLS